MSLKVPSESGAPGFVWAVGSTRILEPEIQNQSRGTFAILPAGVVVKRHMVPGIQLAHARGDIFGLSEGSAARLKRMLMAIPWRNFSSEKGSSEVRGAFATLTYPRDWPDGWQDWKRQLHNYSVRLRERWPLRWCIWKLELQKRGAPHYHLAIAFNDPINIQAFGKWHRRAWFKIVGSDDDYHRRWGGYATGLFVDEARGVAPLMAYLSKYICKTVAPLDPNTGEVINTGRIWGKWGEVDQEVLATGSIIGDQSWLNLISHVRCSNDRSQFLSTLHHDQPGFTVYGDPEQVAKLFAESEIRSD
jgi:hypothetical protein